MPNMVPKESELLPAVIRLFEPTATRSFLEAKLSRKRIDVVFVPDSSGPWTAVELKVRNWKKALWQAAVNRQLAEFSYVALWYTTVPLALDHCALFKSYGVGIVSVTSTDAAIVLEARCTETDTRPRQQLLFLDSLEGIDQKDGDLGALSLLPA